jgi:hypothetical protein
MATNWAVHQLIFALVEKTALTRSAIRAVVAEGKAQSEKELKEFVRDGHRNLEAAAREDIDAYDEILHELNR